MLTAVVTENREDFTYFHLYLSKALKESAGKSITYDDENVWNGNKIGIESVSVYPLSIIFLSVWNTL